MASHLVCLETEALGNSEMALLWSFWTALESLPCFFFLPFSLSLQIEEYSDIYAFIARNLHLQWQDWAVQVLRDKCLSRWSRSSFDHTTICSVETALNCDFLAFNRKLKACMSYEQEFG